MNWAMIKQLVLKDWYFSRIALVLYLAGALAAIGLMLTGDDIAMMISGIGIVAAVMSFGIYLVFITVINERKLGTLPFIMSLPVSYREYTTAKLVSNVAAFLVPWLFLLLVMIGVVMSWADMPNGTIPMLWIMMLEMFVGYLIILAVAMISESEGWTVAAMAIVNTAFSIVFFVVNGIDAIGDTLGGAVAVWSPEALAIIAGEIGLLIAIVALIFYCQSRKTSFL